MPELDLATADEEAIVAAAQKLDDDAVKAIMAGEHRERVLISMIDHMAGTFRADKAGDLDAVLHVKVWDRPDGGYDHFELVIRDGSCTRSPEPAHEPDLTLKASPVDLLKLVTGRSGPRMMAVRGKLRVIGDIRLGTRLPDLFAFG